MSGSHPRPGGRCGLGHNSTLGVPTMGLGFRGWAWFRANEGFRVQGFGLGSGL